MLLVTPVLRVSDGYDRKKPTPQSKFQNGFIAFIVKPLYECLNRSELLHLESFLANIEDNLNNWKRTANQSSGQERKKSVMKRGSVMKEEGLGMGLVGSPSKGANNMKALKEEEKADEKAEEDEEKQ